MEPDRIDPGARLDRRRLLIAGGLLGGAVALAACSSDDGAGDGASGSSGTRPPGGSSGSPTTGAPTTDGAAAGTTGTPPTTAFTAADFSALGVCAVLPELTAGPFPTKDEMERRDITEGREGEPLRVGIQVVDERCTPIRGAAVEIWHCDVDGDYSSYTDGATDDDEGDGTTFLRGTQVTNDDGIVEFATIWPGWYRGRAVHVHSKVHIDDRTALTTQFLFDDDLNTEVMRTGVYAPFGEPDTTNDEDGVSGGDADGSGLLFHVADDADIGGRRALIVVGVDPSA